MPRRSARAAGDAPPGRGHGDGRRASTGRSGRRLLPPWDLLFSSGRDSVRMRHLAARPAVSATYLPGQEFSVTVHGRAELFDLLDPAHGELRQAMLDHLPSDAGARLRDLAAPRRTRSGPGSPRRRSSPSRFHPEDRSASGFRPLRTCVPLTARVPASGRACPPQDVCAPSSGRECPEASDMTPTSPWVLRRGTFRSG